MNNMQKYLDELKVTEAYLQHVMQSSSWLFEETEKRVVHMPFPIDKVKICDRVTTSKIERYAYHAMRHMVQDLLGLKQPVWKTYDSSLRLPRDAILVTADSIHIGSPSGQIRIRGTWKPRSEMPLYVESGDFDVAQVNPLFDWQPEHVCAYLLLKEVT